MNEREIFVAAVAIEDLSARREFLDKRCKGQPELRRRVEQLLDSLQDAELFLQRPIGDVAAAWPTGSPSPVGADPALSPLAVAPTESPHEAINDELRAGIFVGPYRLLEELGEGGMGQVWMAEQHDPVRRLVAIKVIASGMDSRSVLRRFEAERQALALMEHENIARVLDAGTTERGRPYFVMELVKGTPITRYCDEHYLDVGRRLALFMDVCRAIQHAHHKGIIHRDIKPGNILVAESDGRAVVKVIDFGVAKAIGPACGRLTDQSRFTQFGQLVGTLEYMSPEQARLSQLDVDTRSDVYSLGVLLYELLTGTTPFKRQQLQKAAFDEMLRIIREEDPPRPSEELSTSDTLPSVAANRNVEPARLNRLVRGELDWIVMRSLEKNRDRRYGSANALAEDIDNYLHDRSVVASPPTIRYRAAKFIRRHRLGVGVAALMLLTLLTGVVLLWLERGRTLAAKTDADQQRDQAIVEKGRAEANLTLARNVLEDAYLRIGEQWHPADRESIEVREAFLRQALHFYRELSAHNVDGPAQFDQAAAHYRVGKLHELLLEHELAKPEFEQSIRLFQKIIANHSDDWDATNNLLNAQGSLGQTELHLGNRPGRRKQFQSQLETVNDFRARHSEHITAAIAWANISRSIAYDQSISGNREQAIALIEEVDRTLAELTPTAEQEVNFLLARLGVASQLAMQAWNAQKWNDYETMQGRVIDLFGEIESKTRLPEHRVGLAAARCQLAKHFEARGQTDQSRSLIAQATESLSAMADEWDNVVHFDPEWPMVLDETGRLLSQIGDGVRAVKIAATAAHLTDRLVARNRHDPVAQKQRINAYSQLGKYLAAQKDWDRAIEAQQTIIRMHLRLSEDFPDTPEHIIRWASALDGLAAIQKSAGQLDAARDSFRAAEEGLQSARKRFPQRYDLASTLGRIRAARAQSLISEGKREEGISVFREALPELVASVHLGDENVATLTLAIDLHLIFTQHLSAQADEYFATLASAQEVVDVVLRKFPSRSRFREQSANIKLRQCQGEMERKNYAVACEWAEQSISDMQEAIRLDANANPNLSVQLADQNLEYAWTLLRGERYVESIAAAAESAKPESRRLLERWSTLQLLDLTVDKLRAQTQSPDVLASIQQGIELGKSLSDVDVSAESNIALAANFVWWLANTKILEIRNPAAAEQMATQLLERATAKPDRANLLTTIGASRYRLNDSPGAQSALDQLAAEKLTLTLRGLFVDALVRFKAGQFEQAQASFDAGLSRLEAEPNAELQYLADEAAELLGRKR